VETIIDPAQDPDAKIRLLSGRMNVARCPNCGYAINMSSPLMYHDASKELLLTYVPMELNLPKDQQEKVIGDMMRELTSRLPKEAMKGYLFQPKQMLTMQGMVENVLQADGVTPEMMEAQRQRVGLIETLLQTPPENLPTVIHEHDAEIDAQVLQTLTLMAQRMAQEGRGDIAEQMAILQEYLLAESSFGQMVLAQSQQQQETVQQVAADLDALGENATRADFLDLAARYADDDQKLQALVGLIRPAFDYRFFQDLTVQIGQAPADERDAWEALRERLLQLIEVVDQQSQAAMQGAAQLLGALLNAGENVDALILESLPLLDDTFLAVLQANIQEAERQKDVQASARLKDIYNRVITALRANMRPELQFINDLLAAPSEEEARQMIAEQADTYGEPLLEMMQAVEELLAARGEEAVRQRLALLREAATEVLG
ncbi:MAG: CpXC domain-containing protein, partial [Acidobacteriales bacterium]|nr:CpXC domain-containing protein [Terriglobales bacterium]